MTEEPSSQFHDVRASFTHAAETRSPDLRQMFAAQYERLRELVRQLFKRERTGISVNPTDIVHEAYEALIDQTKISARGTTFFRRCCAQQCRTLLVNHARKRNALRHGGGMERVSLSDQSGLVAKGSLDVLMLNDALEALEHIRKRLAEVAELCMFAGMNAKECADALGVSLRTVQGDLAFLREWFSEYRTEK